MNVNLHRLGRTVPASASASASAVVDVIMTIKAAQRGEARGQFGLRNKPAANDGACEMVA